MGHQGMKFDKDLEEEIIPARPSFSQNPVYRSIFYQGILLCLVLALCYYLFVTTSANLKRLGISSGFDFLYRVSGFDVATKFIPYDETSTYFRAFLVGLLNTVIIAVLCIIMATVLGFAMGIMRLSSNRLLSFFAAAFVEFNRNIPLLLHLFFWYFAVLRSLPGVRDSIAIFDIIFLNVRGLFLPAPVFAPGFIMVPAAVAVGLVSVILLARWAKHRREETGQPFHTFYCSAAIIIGLPLLMLIVTGFPVSWDIPSFKGFNFVGGLHLSPEFVALWFALSVYSSAYIAEIVRGGLQAVDRTQIEAAYALGLRKQVATALIVIPQALRITVPPLGNMYLIILKDSSLAAAIGYPDLMLTFGGTVLSHTGQVLEVMGIVMAVYLVICLAISFLVNLYNRRTAWGER
jgi:general L-amino acid transport system permease protein